MTSKIEIKARILNKLARKDIFGV